MTAGHRVRLAADREAPDVVEGVGAVVATVGRRDALEDGLAHRVLTGADVLGRPARLGRVRGSANRRREAEVPEGLGLQEGDDLGDPCAVQREHVDAVRRGSCRSRRSRGRSRRPSCPLARAGTTRQRSPAQRQRRGSPRPRRGRGTRSASAASPSWRPRPASRRRASTSLRSHAATYSSTIARRRSSPSARSVACWLRSGSRSSTVLWARCSALYTDAGVVSSASATSSPEKPSTSRRISTARWRAGRCWSAAMKASSTLSRCS